jgi:hypothetical protein
MSDFLGTTTTKILRIAVSSFFSRRDAAHPEFLFIIPPALQGNCDGAGVRFAASEKKLDSSVYLIYTVYDRLISVLGIRISADLESAMAVCSKIFQLRSHIGIRDIQ